MPEATDLLTGSIDPHVHAAPDRWERPNDVVDVVRAASDAGMCCILLVNHFTETASQAAIVDRVVDGVGVRGAIKLNRPVGGLNSDAVETMLELGAAKIDMPTHHSENDLAIKGEDSATGVSGTRDGELREAMFEIFDLVREYDGAIATGNLTAAEVQQVVEGALDHRIERPVVSHSELPSVALPVDARVALAHSGAMMEYCYVSTSEVLHDYYEFESPLMPGDILDMAAAVGPESVILAIDYGHPANPSPSDGMRAFIENALVYGFDEDEIELMV